MSEHETDELYLSVCETLHYGPDGDVTERRVKAAIELVRAAERERIAEAVFTQDALEAATEAGYAAAVNGVFGETTEPERTGRQIMQRSHRAAFAAALRFAGVERTET